MAGSFKFAVLRLEPNDAKREVLNIGVAVFVKTGVEFFFSKGLEKVRAISRATNLNEIVEITSNISDIYSSLIKDRSMTFEDRYELISDFGPVKLALGGEFAAGTTHAFNERVSALLSTYVDPEVAVRNIKEKRSRVLTDIKRVFRLERVLAKPHEDLTSHRIVPSVQIDEGLVADLVLRNGAFHVTETVDASGEQAGLRKVISDLGVSTLVLERAKMNFQGTVVKGSLVYTASRAIERSLRPALDAAEHLEIQLINWDSDSDRDQYISGLVSLAVPYQDRKTAKPQAIVGGRLHFH